MKKFFYFFAATLVAMTMGLTACDDSNGNNPSGGGGGSSNPSGDQLTPEENKEKIISVATQMIDKINPEDQREAIELVEGVYNKYQKYSFEGIESSFKDELGGLFKLPMYARRVAAGDLSAAMDLEDQVINISFEKFAAEFEADDASQSFVKKGTPSDNSVILRFLDPNGIQCEAKFWGEGKIKVLEYTYEESHEEWNDVTSQYEKVSDGMRTIHGEIPAKICFYLKHGSNEIARVEFTQELVKDDHAHFTAYARVTNISWDAALKINSTNGSASMNFNYDKDKLFGLAVNLPSYKLIPKGDLDYEEWIEKYEDEWESLIKACGGASAEIDIFSQIQLKASIKNVGAAYTEFRDLMQNSNGETDQKTQMGKICNFINSNQDNGLYYNSSVKQAEVRAQVSESEDYEGYKRYNMEAVLYFPQDKTTYSFEEYFASKPFQELMETVINLANKYIDMSPFLYDAVGGELSNPFASNDGQSDY